jgi:hypothetical protein
MTSSECLISWQKALAMCLPLMCGCGSTHLFALQGRLLDEFGRSWPRGQIELPALGFSGSVRGDGTFSLRGRGYAGCYLAWIWPIDATRVAISFDPADQQTHNVGSIRVQQTPVSEVPTKAVIGCPYLQDSLNRGGWGVDTIRVLR